MHKFRTLPPQRDVHLDIGQPLDVRIRHDETGMDRETGPRCVPNPSETDYRLAHVAGEKILASLTVIAVQPVSRFWPFCPVALMIYAVAEVPETVIA